MSEALANDWTRAAAADAASETHAFEFTGAAGEYFRIWIVNVTLSILTLGIYSAWAKVRSASWFAAHTRVAGASFEYLADPLSILKGRLIVLVFLVLYGVTSIAPLIQGVVGLAIAVCAPWAIQRSLAFRAHNTAWRNIRFAFGGTYGEAFIAYIVLPIAGLLSLGLAYPYALFTQRRFMVDHAAFGTTRLRFTAIPSQFYLMSAKLSMLAIAGVVVFLVIAAGVGSGNPLSERFDPVTLASPVALAAVYFLVFAAWSAQMANLTYDNTEIGPHRLHSRVPIAGLAFVYFTNAIAVLASLGLLIPWAEVRTARYRLAHMGLTASGSLDEFVAAQGTDVSSLGAEFGEAFDFDLGL